MKLLLPVDAFIGRDRELTDLAAAIRRSRLLVLTGAPGVGKTRLARELAGRLAPRYPGGVHIVELAAISDPALVPQVVARSLGVSEQATRSAVESLAARLGGRRVLLVLDNCEHLIAACAELAHTLISACPHLTVLVTSQVAMGGAGERVWPVAPLSLPEAAMVLYKRPGGA